MSAFAGTTTDTRRSTTRFVGLDVARLLAILGMMAAHLWAPEEWYWPEGTDRHAVAVVVAHITEGNASSLFAVLGGVSLTLASLGVRRTYGRWGVVLATITRGLLVVAIGSLIAIVPTPVVAVLVPFGVAMIVAAPFLLLPSWILAPVVIVGWAVTGTVTAAAHAGLGMPMEGGSLPLPDLVLHPVDSLRAIFLSGTYPVITWLVYVLMGVLVGRALTAARRRARVPLVAAVLAGAGLALFVAATMTSDVILGALAPDERALFYPPSYGGAPTTEAWGQWVAQPHTGTIADIARTAGLAVAVIGLCVLLLDRRDGSARRPFIVRWLQTTGAAPLTIYVFHYLLTFTMSSLQYGGVPGALLWAWQTLAILWVGLTLLLTGWRGPLEALIARAISTVLRPLPRRTDADQRPAAISANAVMSSSRSSNST